jgi:Bacterial TSP3 repeat
MQRLLIVAVSLSLSLVGLSGSVLAQTNSGVVVIDDASGASGTNRINGNCEISGSGRDRLVTCTDLSPGRGTALTDPGTESATVAPEPAPPAPAPDTASAPAPSDAAVATVTDQDADNAPDELEPGMGLDPTNPDTDADHVADGDEGNIYGTDPLNADTDGDGVSDGEELFATHTDPLA